MNRELGTFERALVIADGHAPFHIVRVLRLESAPPTQLLRNSLKVLQSHHPFLSARMLKEKGRYYFAKLVEPGLPYRVLSRWNDEHWIQVAEVEMANRIDVSTGPLFHCTYLFDATRQRGEIILTLYHAIADSFSMARLMHELLKIALVIILQRYSFSLKRGTIVDCVGLNAIRPKNRLPMIVNSFDTPPAKIPFKGNVHRIVDFN